MVASCVELIPKTTQFLSKFKTQNVIKSKTCILMKNKKEKNECTEKEIESIFGWPNKGYSCRLCAL